MSISMNKIASIIDADDALNGAIANAQTESERLYLKRFAVLTRDGQRRWAVRLGRRDDGNQEESLGFVVVTRGESRRVTSEDGFHCFAPSLDLSIPNGGLLRTITGPFRIGYDTERCYWDVRLRSGVDYLFIEEDSPILEEFRSRYYGI